MDDVILRIRELSKSFSGIRAVKDVSFDVARGKVTAVIGPNGAGKTTLFSAVSGFHHPNSGRVELEGKDITGMQPHRVAAEGLVRTFQLVRLFRDMSLRENVMVGGHLTTRGGLLSSLVRPHWYGRQQQELAERAEQNLAFVGLGHLAEASASTLTYGQQRKLEVARALAAKPRLLLLDEPAAGLSMVESRELLGIIRSIAESGTSVMIIDHDMTLVMDVADRIVVLDSGRKICEGTPETVRHDADVLSAYLGSLDRPSRRRKQKVQVG